MKTKTTRTISLVALAIFASNTVALPAMCEEGDDMLAKASESSVADDGKPKTIVLNLTRLRDNGLAIRLIKQQALNIFLEATRTEIKPTDQCTIPEPVSPKVAVTRETCGSYLAPRKEWLVVYLTALEPVSQLLSHWRGGVKGGTIVRKVAKGTATKFRPVNEAFFVEAKNIETQLDKLNDIFESEKPDNVELAGVSKGLLESARNLEKLREQEFDILKEAAEKGVTETEVL